MPAVVVYESMFGSTRKVAGAIARGLARNVETVVAPVAQATPEIVAGASLIVIGGPTHMHTMSRPTSRRIAGEVAGKPGSGVALEPGATGPGLREWFDSLGTVDVACAAFDTRGPASALLTGRASKRIQRLLRRHGARPICSARSFVVDKDNTLAPGELTRAEQWGGDLAGTLLAMEVERHDPRRAG
jgi:hypothetical protein